jgi:peptidoglycan/xylan/chitin deacetylase (PgdA/CDA1 family)
MSEVDMNEGRVPLVLMYHSIETYAADPYLVTVRPERFIKQMEWLRRHGVRGVSMRELLHCWEVGLTAKLVGLTFDDGYEDFATEVLPVLSEYGFTATVFVVAGRVGGLNAWDWPAPSKRLLSAEQVRMVADAGMEVGSHSVSHVALTSVTPDALTTEAKQSQAILEDVIGQEVAGFSYPYGAHSAREVEAVQAAGYRYGCAVARSQFVGRYALPRTYIGDRDGGVRMLAKWFRHKLIRGW